MHLYIASSGARQYRPGREGFRFQIACMIIGKLRGICRASGQIRRFASGNTRLPGVPEPSGGISASKFANSCYGNNSLVITQLPADLFGSEVPGNLGFPNLLSTAPYVPRIRSTIIEVAVSKYQEKARRRIWLPGGLSYQMHLGPVHLPSDRPSHQMTVHLVLRYMTNSALASSLFSAVQFLFQFGGVK
jgi:hypothetical protein